MNETFNNIGRFKMHLWIYHENFKVLTISSEIKFTVVQKVMGTVNIGEY